jgi:hypothetical protein
MFSEKKVQVLLQILLDVSLHYSLCYCMNTTILEHSRHGWRSGYTHVDVVHLAPERFDPLQGDD